jgi:hypothetical protein
LEIGRTTVDRIDPRVRRAGYGFARPFAVDRWDRAPDGSWIALLRSGEFPQHPGQRYMIPPGHMPYHLDQGPTRAAQAGAAQPRLRRAHPA